MSTSILAQGARDVVTDYGAIGDGVTDDTQAFLAALQLDRDLNPVALPNYPQDLMNKKGVSVYVPPGTYLISATIALWGGTHFFGEPSSWPTLKLKDGAAGFGKAPTGLGDGSNGTYNPNANNGTGVPFITVVNGFGTVNGDYVSNNWYAYSAGTPTNPHGNPNGSANNTFGVYMENFVLDLGKNPGAVGIRWITAQESALRNVIVNGGQGVACVDTALGGGGGLIANLTCKGGGIGVYYYYTAQELFRSCSFTGQTIYSLIVTPALQTGLGAFIGCKFDNTAPVITYDSVTTTFYDCTFSNMPGPCYVFGYGNDGCRMLHVENLNFGPGCKVPTFFTPFLSDTGNGNSVVETYNEQPITYNGSPISTTDSRNAKVVSEWSFAVMDMPMPSSACVNVASLGIKGDGVTDNTVAIQAALAQHDELYFPGGNYLVSDTLTIRPGTRLWMGKSLAPNCPPFLNFAGYPSWKSTELFPVETGSITLVPGAAAFSDPQSGTPFINVTGDGSNPVFMSGFRFLHFCPGGIPLIWGAASTSAMFDSHAHRMNGDYRARADGSSTDEQTYLQYVLVSYQPTIWIKTGGYIENCHPVNGMPVLGDQSRAGVLVTSTERLFLYTFQPEHYTNFALVFSGASDVVGVHLQFEDAFPPFVPKGYSAGRCSGEVMDFSQFMLLENCSNMHLSAINCAASGPTKTYAIEVDNCSDTRIFAACGFVSIPIVKEILSGGETNFYDPNSCPANLTAYQHNPNYPCVFYQQGLSGYVRT